jgi:hypothetical protein
LLLILGAIASKCACIEQAALHLESLDGLHFTYPSYPGKRPADSKELYKYKYIPGNFFRNVFRYLIGSTRSQCDRSSCGTATFSSPFM